MQYTVTVEAELAGSIESIWAVLADMPAYPTWDARVAECELDGPFATGTTGRSVPPGGKGSAFRLVEVVPGERWTNELPLPGGRLMISYDLAATGSGRVQVTKTYVAHGPVAIAFRLWYARGIRRELPETFAALEAEAARRVRA